MNAFQLSKKAKNDLKNIARFTERRWGRKQRFLYIKQFDDVFHSLAKSPSMGKKCDDIKEDYRKFPQGSHIIFYRESENNKILMIRILHKNMDEESKFLHT